MQDQCQFIFCYIYIYIQCIFFIFIVFAKLFKLFIFLSINFLSYIYLFLLFNIYFTSCYICLMQIIIFKVQLFLFKSVSCLKLYFFTCNSIFKIKEKPKIFEINIKHELKLALPFGRFRLLLNQSVCLLQHFLKSNFQYLNTY